MTMESIQELCRPLVAVLREVDWNDAAAARQTLTERLPLDCEAIQSLRAEVENGVREGWLCPKSNGPVQFGRVTRDIDGHSVDAVIMNTPGPRHRHPNGEASICFALDGNPRFDSHGEGWVVYPPDSVHTPTVRDGTMAILYFLPGGAMEFLADS